MKRSMEEEIRELDRISEYQRGYRDGWVDALRICGVLTPELMHRVESKLRQSEPK